MDRPQPSKARPCAAKGEIRIDELPGDPVADRKADDEPNHRENDAGFAGIVIILGKPFVGRLGCVIVLSDQEDCENAIEEDQPTVNADWIVAACQAKHYPADRNHKADKNCVLSLISGELGNHDLTHTATEPNSLDSTRV